MGSNNSRTKDEGGEDEAGEAGAQDVEHARTERDWRMPASPQRPPTIKDMECLKQEDNGDKEDVEETTRKRIKSSTTIGTCVSRVDLMCHGGTQAKHAHRNAAERDIRKTATGATTSDTCN